MYCFEANGERQTERGKQKKEGDSVLTRVALDSIDSRSPRSASQFRRRRFGFTLAAPCKLIHEAVLLGSAHVRDSVALTASLSSPQSSNSAFVHKQLGFTLAAANSTAKLAIQFGRSCLVLPLQPLRIELRSLHLLFQLLTDKLGVTLVAVFELIREVALLDQSVRIVRAPRNVCKRYFGGTMWKSVHACARNFLARV
jgi:hypothetical protein